MPTHRLKLIAFLFATSFLFHSAWVQAADEPLPYAANLQAEGFSSERLARLTSITQAHVESGILPGAVMLVARNGKIVYLESVGFRDRAANAPMTEDAIFRLYSMTKPVTSVAVMMLHEDGRLQITDPVSRYLPEFAAMQVGTENADGSAGTEAAIRQITIQDLLRHTSGLTYGNRGQTAVHRLYQQAGIGNRDRSNAEFVSPLAKLPLRFQPGTRWEYSVSTDVLGRLVEVISGMTLGEFFEEHIFQPLGMRDTSFFLAADKLDRAAQPWAKPGVTMTPRFDVAVDAAFQAGGGGLMGTAADYLRFAQMLLNGGEFNGVRLLSPRTVTYMTADHLGGMPGQQPGMGFGLGFQVRKEVGMAGWPGSVGEYGWAGNAGTIFWVDPQQQLIGIYMVQVNEGDRVYLRNQFRTLVSQAMEEVR